jgi:putative Holliday junction resolvase
MRIMAVDFGDARTGIALSDTAAFLASPICVIHEKNFNAIVKKTASLAIEHKAELLVVGYPKNMNNTIGVRAEKSQKFALLLENATGIKVELWDERCTTMSAHVFMNATDTRGKKRKETVDAAAATIILQDYLDFLRNKV